MSIVNTISSKDLKEVRIEDIEPNPYRNVEKLGYNEQKLKKIGESYSQFGLMGTVFPCRPHPIKKGKYQLILGHSRLHQLELENGKESIVMIQIMILNDEEMKKGLIISDNEIFGQCPASVVGTIRAIKKEMEKKGSKKSNIEEAVNIEFGWSTAAIGRRSTGSNASQLINLIEQLDDNDPRLNPKVIEILPTIASLLSFYRMLRKGWTPQGLPLPPDRQEQVANKLAQNPETAATNAPLYINSEIQRLYKNDRSEYEKMAVRHMKSIINSLGKAKGAFNALNEVKSSMSATELPLLKTLFVTTGLEKSHVTFKTVTENIIENIKSIK